MEIHRQDIQTHLNLPSTVMQKSHDWKPICAYGPKSDWNVLKISSSHPIPFTLLKKTYLTYNQGNLSFRT